MTASTSRFVTTPGLPEVALAETRSRAGQLLEPGAAFARTDGERLRPPGGQSGTPVTGAAEERFDVVVIGAGQAGLSVGYRLAQLGLRFVLLESGARVGDNWRSRWDSLRLFTPARYDGLEGMPFPAAPRSFPTKAEMADYLERYAERFQLPVRPGVRVRELTREGDTYRLTTTSGTACLASHVVIASGAYQAPRIPAFASAMAPSIRQLHSSQYQRPAQLQPGRVLLVGAGNSGAEIALDLARTHEVCLAGRHPGHLPVPHDSAVAYHVIVPVVFRLVFHRLLSVDTPMGRKAKPHFLQHGGPWIRVRPADLERAGVQRVARVSGVRDGQPVLEDGQRIATDNVVWCTGFGPSLDWVRLPICDAGGRPRQYRGAVEGEPGLYFAGLFYQHSPSSSMVHGAARDAAHVAGEIARRTATAACARAGAHA